MLVVLGCQPEPPPSDPVLYTQALTGGGLSTDARLELCEQIRDADLLADCVAGVLRWSSLSHEERCMRIPASRWQDECWFQYAEFKQHSLSPAAAAAACQRAGRYTSSCINHVQFKHVLALYQTEPRDEQIEDLAQAWEAALQRPTARVDTWRFYWELEFKQAVDPRRCASASEPKGCRDALVSHYRFQLSRLLRQHPQRWCEVDATPFLLAEWQAPPDDALTQDLDRIDHILTIKHCR